MSIYFKFLNICLINAPLINKFCLQKDGKIMGVMESELHGGVNEGFFSTSRATGLWQKCMRKLLNNY